MLSSTCPESCKGIIFSSPSSLDLSSFPDVNCQESNTQADGAPARFEIHPTFMLSDSFSRVKIKQLHTV